MTLPIVGIGASAGGLKEFEHFFKNMPEGKQAAYVIIQHLDPNHKSMLVDIVGRYTDMDVLEIKDNMQPEAGKVYIIPPNKTVSLEEDRLELSTLTREGGRHLPIDTFFRSLKESLKEKAIAVILSGTGSDGTAGIKHIKEAGGLVLVQEPETAQYDGMPLSAVKTGLVDYVLPVEKMSEAILNYIENEFDNHKLLGADDEKTFDYINEIFKLIKVKTGNDFSNYKRNTIHRRIERRLTVNKIDSLKDYVQFLKKDKREISILYKELLISVTNFFRDPKIFEYIDEKIVPRIVSEAQDQTIRIWVPACATGEEAYSLAILFKQYIDKNQLDIDVQVFASDIDTDAVLKARDGYYNKNIEADVPPVLLKKFFLKEKNGYQIKKSIREIVIFADQNLLQDPPYSRLDLISCRNLLIYLDTDLQQKAINVFHYSLRNDGILILGSSESLGASARYFNAIERKSKIFSKIENKSLASRVWNVSDSFEKNKPAISANKPQKVKSLPELTHDFIVEHHTPPAIVINPEGEIVYVHGKTGKYLEISTGEISTNILRVAREGLKIALNSLIRKAKKTNDSVITGNVVINSDDGVENIDIVVSPLKKSTEHTNLFVILFKPSLTGKKEKRIKSETDKEENAAIHELEKELLEKDEYLQNTIEELETTNEELKSANEEAQSTNEELQSTNEELETSKEELQSVNEELTTTNNELNLKIEQLNKVSNTLKNLLSSTQIATIFLDKKLKIFSFTPAVSAIIDLIESDIGRSLEQFTNKLEYADFMKDARRVLHTLVPKEREVTTPDHRYFWMRIIPYRTLDDTIEGLVITFTDITEKKRQEEELDQHRHHLEELVKKKGAELQKSEERFREISAVSSDYSYSYTVSEKGDFKLQWTFGNFRKLTGYSEFDILKGDNQKVIIHPDDLDQVRKGKQKLLEGETVVNEVRIITKSGKTKWIREKAVPAWDEKKQRINQIISTIQDITEIKKSEQIIIEKEKMFSRTERVANIGSWEWDIEPDIVKWSDELFNIFGIDPMDGAPAFADQNRIFSSEDYKTLSRVLNKAINEGVAYELEIDAIRSNGEVRHCIVRGYPEKDSNGKVFKFYGSFQDITERKKAEKILRESEANLRMLNSTKDKLFSIIGHDLNTPIANISGFSSLIEEKYDRLDDEQIRKYNSFIMQSAQNLSTLLNNLLTWARAQRNAVDYNPQKVGLKEFIDRGLSFQSITSDKKGIRLINSVDPSLNGYMDEDTMTTVLRNLVSNAIKFTHPGGSVTVDARNSKNEIIIGVHDNGIGIEKDKLGSIFDLTESQSTPGTNNEKGTGLGLVICKEFVEINKGRIWAESQPGKRTSFYFTVPRYKKGRQITEKSEKSEFSAKYTFLLVEDDEMNFLLLQASLKNVLGPDNVEILHAKTGEEAIESCKKNEQVQMVFMDVRMPGMDGYEATEKIKSIRPDLPIIMQTAKPSLEGENKAYQLGCNEYLFKPISDIWMKKILEKYLVIKKKES